MKLLAVLLLFISTTVFADPFAYIVGKYETNPAFTVLESTTESITVRTVDGIQIFATKDEVNAFVKDVAKASGETDSFIESLFTDKKLSYRSDLTAQRVILNGVRFFCGVSAGTCAAMAATGSAAVLPAIVGSTCALAAGDCFQDANKKLENVDAEMKAWDFQHPKSSGGASDAPMPSPGHSTGGGFGSGGVKCSTSYTAVTSFSDGISSTTYAPFTKCTGTF